MILKKCLLLALLFVSFFANVSLEDQEPAQQFDVDSAENEFVNGETCEYRQDISKNHKQLLEASTMSSVQAELLIQNKVFAKFENTYYGNHHKPCLMKKQLRLQPSSKNSRQPADFKRNKAKISQHVLYNPCELNRVDWTFYTGRAKNQDQCGSCWAFATSTVLAAQMAIETQSKHPVHISEQYMVDCDDSNSGCNGGYMDRALEFLDTYGYVLASEYPYDGVKHRKCRANATAIKKLNNIEIVNYFKSSEEELVSLLEHGPLVVAICAGQSLYSYSEGILANCGMKCTVEKLNHAVVLKGFGSDNGIPYFEIQNSWTDEWGENGSFKVLRDGKCRCGICLEPSQIKLRKDWHGDHNHPDAIDNINGEDDISDGNDAENQKNERSKNGQWYNLIKPFDLILNLINP